MKQLRILLDGMLVHPRVTPPPHSMSPVPILYTWVKRDWGGRDWASNHWPSVQRANHYTTVPPPKRGIHKILQIKPTAWNVHLSSSLAWEGRSKLKCWINRSSMIKSGRRKRKKLSSSSSIEGPSTVQDKEGEVSDSETPAAMATDKSWLTYGNFL